jgi:copper transport protein
MAAPRDQNDGGEIMGVMVPRRWLALLGVFSGMLVALLLPASPASAHATLERADPSANTIVQTAPTDVVLTFSEAVRPIVDKIRVTGPDGKRADAAKPAAVDRQLRIPLLTGGPQGTYLVSYRVISADSHPISGGFSYSVGQVSATPTPVDTAAQNVKTDPVVAAAVGVSRYVGFAGLVLLIGPALVLLALWPRRLSTTGPARLAMGSIVLLALSTVAELYLQIPYTSGTGLFSASAVATSQVMATPFAAAHLIRLGVLAAVTVLLRPVIAGTAGKVDQTFLVILGVVGLATWSISGHPSASPVPTLTVVADIAHLASMAVWLGGLVMLFGFLLRKASDRELGAILPVWSGWAMLAVTVLVLAGTAQALVEIGTVSALTGTTYGKLVMLKVGLLAIVLCVAAYSRRLVNTRFTPEEPDDEAVEPVTEAPKVDLQPARKRLRLGVMAEVAIAAFVLTISATLVQTTPAGSAEASANGPAQPFSTTLTSKLFRLEIDLEPARKGVNTFHLYAYKPNGSGTQTVVEWTGTAALPAQGIEPISIPMLAITTDHSSGQILLPSSGTWNLRFTVRIDDTNEDTVTTKVPVR